MKQKAFAIIGGLLLGFVALFTLVHLLKAALGLAFLFFAGRGLMRLWMYGGRMMQRNTFRNSAHDYPVLGSTASYAHNTAPRREQQWASQGIVPVY